VTRFCPEQEPCIAGNIKKERGKYLEKQKFTSSAYCRMSCNSALRRYSLFVERVQLTDSRRVRLERRSGNGRLIYAVRVCGWQPYRLISQRQKRSKVYCCTWRYLLLGWRRRDRTFDKKHYKPYLSHILRNRRSWFRLRVWRLYQLYSKVAAAQTLSCFRACSLCVWSFNSYIYSCIKMAHG